MEGWQHHFKNLMTDGELCFDGEDYEGARQLYQEAFKLIPEPKREFNESTQVIGALADCFYFLEDYEKAKVALDDILLCPGGAANPFIRLRRGQVFHRTGDDEKARTELTTAFLNGGTDVFEGEEEFLDLISDVVSGMKQ
ncbi:Tetratricopeptide repeat protein [Gimesia maris]|nr:Tetratricopeptide repeat protein [Gimesia maris]